jgi:hypothetical protein
MLFNDINSKSTIIDDIILFHVTIVSFAIIGFRFQLNCPVRSPKLVHWIFPVVGELEIMLSHFASFNARLVSYFFSDF